MRRHLARLVSLNLIARRDSPNGKRYQRNYGGEVVAYGFDLSPLFHRLGEIRSHADSARRTQSEIAALREEIALQRRDLVALLNPAESCEALSELCRVLRRRLSCEDLKAISARLKQLIITHTPIQVTEETSSLSNSDAQSEQQYHNTIINLSESVAESIDNPATPISDLRNTEDDNPSLEMVLSTCGKLQEFTSAPIQTWSNLLRAIEIIYPMMGIGPSTWHSAKTHLGATNAAAIVAAILERFEKIRSPNAYLNSLVMRYSKGLLRFKAIFSALRSLSPSSQL